MTELERVFLRLNLEQYLETFIEEGFDTWDTVLDITETDLDSLGVKLGHRRKLQREIANWRGVGHDESLRTPPTRAPSTEDSFHGDYDSAAGPSKTAGRHAAGGTGKRKYRRHPKVDEHAPVRGPSAYVIFSNKVREDLKSQNLSFTEIAKRVGERWQTLSPERKEPYESQAALAKDRYNTEMIEYKKTNNFRLYSEYLVDFKAKNAAAAGAPEPVVTEGKRPRLNRESIGRNSHESQTSLVSAFTGLDRERQSWDNAGSVGTPSSASAQNSPTGNLPSPMVLGAHLAMGRSSPPEASPKPFGYNRPPGSSQGSQLFPTYPPRTQQLPRIVPLERRDPTMLMQTQLPPLPNDPNMFRGSGGYSNPRRSDKVVPAQFLRQDTSISSIASSRSSKSSSISTAPSSHGPVTPIEEGKRHRALPPLTSFTQPVLGATFGEQAPGDFQPTVTHSTSAFGSISSLAIQSNTPSSSASPADRASVFHLAYDLNFPETRQLPALSQPSPLAPLDTRVEGHRPDTYRQLTEHGQRARRLRDEEPPSSQGDSPLDMLALAGKLMDRSEQESPS